MDIAPNSLDIPIDRDSIEAFAAFSGDRSALHMDTSFGRRSMYGGNVVHGMLPVMFLAYLIPEGVRINRIQGRFLTPLFPGDKITLSTSEGPSSGVDRKLFFEVRRGDTLATRGSLLLSPAGPDASPKDASAQGLVSSGSLEADHAFEDITIGMRSTVDLQWGGAQLNAFRALLGRSSIVIQPQCSADLAAVGMLSTLVGMYMPGRTATFQEFELRFNRTLPKGTSRLTANVAFRSAATNTIVQEVTFDDGTSAIAQGKVSVHVAQAPFKAPSMETLAHTGIGFGLEGQVVLITGASRGIGATTAKLFALHGALVVIDHRSSAAEADAVVNEIIAYGGKAMAVRADVTDAEAVLHMVRAVEKEFGQVDVLVNNAANNFRPIPFLDTRWDQVQADIDTILKGAFNMAQAVIPGFLEKGGGRIVNVSTIAVEAPPAQQTKYVLAKSALSGLTRSLAVEFADRNIRVNMVVPSFVETDLTSGQSRVEVSRMKASSPMKRLASAQDVAEAIVHLASPRSAYTTGQKLMVTGGLAPFL